MAIKFQYNKTSLGDLDKQLRMRTRALPTIKSKEAALRGEVKRARDIADHCRRKLDEMAAQYDYMTALWGEFDPELLKIRDVQVEMAGIAGVKFPVLKDVVFEQKAMDLFGQPAWIADGVELLKKLARMKIGHEVFRLKTEVLDRARRKTTQKVNLYEKVQIPGYEDAIRKIKRFLEDEENLSKSAQKIVKSRRAAAQTREEAAP